jgi:hypothetical protein
MSVVEQLENRLMPPLKQAVAVLQREFLSFRIAIWSSSVGSLTQYQGHDVGIDCLLPDAPPEQPDNVCLSIGVRHVTTTPEICDASVCWGAPSGDIELDVVDEPLPFSAEMMSRIEAELPRLVDALRIALRRGKPVD